MKKLIYAGAVLCMMAGLGSCSMLQGGEKKSAQRKTTLPTDRESVHQVRAEREYSSEDLAKGAVKGDWAIEEVYGEHPKGLTAPFLKFVPAEKRVYGNNGCNVINAGYVYNPADSTLSFTHIAATMRLCDEEGLKEAEIARALDSTVRYTWDIRDSQYILHLFDASGAEVMQLMHQNFDFLNGAWAVTYISDTPVDDPEMKLVIDVDEGRIHGNTGCNILNGSFEIDMERANSISFSSLATTRRACPNPERQTALLVALEDAVSARPVDKETVRFINASGATVLTLQRTNPN